MFLGHFSVALAAKRTAPAVSLGTLFLAAQFIDLLWPTFLLLGVEEVRIAPGFTAATPLHFIHYPWTHSLLAAAGWGLLLGAAYYAARRSLPAAFVVGLLVVSHWLLDLLVHVPDLPLTPAAGSPLFGFGLWQSLPATLALESVLFVVGATLYFRGTRAVDSAGRWMPIALCAFLCAIQLANFFGPPPERVADIAIVGHAQWLLVWFGYVVDRHRIPLAA